MSNSSVSNKNSYSNGGLSGLASGLDTESMVQAMLQATQNKIDKQNQDIQRTTWKQDVYRDVIKKLQSFQSTYFNYLNNNKNIMSPAFFNTVAVSSSHKAVSVTNKDSNVNSQLTIDKILQLATTSKQTGTDNISDEIKFDLDVSKISTDPAKPTTVTVNFDGIEKKIELKGTTNQELADNFNQSLKDAYGNGISANLNSTTGKMEVVTSSKDRNVSISASSSEARETLGMSGSYVSNKVSLSTRLGDLNLNTELVGDTFAFKINGKEFQFSADASLDSVISAVNSSDANVKLSFDSINDRFVMESTQTGAGMGIKIEDISGNLMSSIMGSKGSSLATSVLNQKKFDTSLNGNVDLDGKLSEGKLSFNINGKSVSLSIPATEDAAATDKVLDTVNEELARQLKDNGIEGTINAKINADGTFGFEVSDNLKLSFNEAGSDSLQAKLGIASKADNVLPINNTTTLDRFGIKGTNKVNVNGTEISISESMSIDDLKSAFSGAGVTVDLAEGKLSMYSANEITVNDVGGGNVMSTLFNTSSITFNKSGALGTFVDGKNAILSVNGVEIERNTNDFELNGFQVSLKETYNIDGGSEPIKISATRDISKVTSTIKEFVEAYNAIIKDVNGLYREASDYKKYPPLSDAQKKEMSETEIDKWEEKGKTGLLRGDSLLSGVLSDFRNMVYSKTSEDGIALYDLGITTTKDGELEINENTLNAMVETNIDKISDLFTNKEKGLSVQMNKIVDDYAKSSIASPGKIVSKAGIKNTASEISNTMFDQLKSMQENITRLNNKYKIEKKRYWAQFNSLEKIISNSNATSNWLSSSFQ